MTLQIVGYESKESESFRIEYWYNRQTRDWVVQVYDNNDVQQDSSYCPDKGWRDCVIAEFSEKYNTTDIIKV